MDKPLIDTLAERLVQLERECDGLKRQTRRFKGVGVAIALGAALFMIAGARRDDAPKELEVERLVLRGDDGKVYAELGVQTRRGDGVRFPSLRFRDEDGKTRFYVGRSELKFFDKDERGRFDIDTLPDESVCVNFHDKEGWTELTMGKFIDGAAGMHLFGPNGKGQGGRDHGGLFVNNDGSTLLHLFRPGSLAGEDTHERVALGVEANGSTRLILRGADFNTAIRASIPPVGQPKLQIDNGPNP